MVLGLCGFAFILALPAAAQRVAVLTPDKAETSKTFAQQLETHLAKTLNILDNSLSEAAYLSTSSATLFNLTADVSKGIGAAIGCDSFILVRSAIQRRSAYQRNEYYEAYAVIYVVSSRTGHLVFWKLHRFDAEKADKAATLLAGSAAVVASETAEKLRAAIRNESTESDPPPVEEVPDEASPAAKNFRAPIPYRRIKPEYTAQASLYDITATVDLLVDLDEKGTILRTQVLRWAGFGLDESVEKTVRSMNWRPAERNGKPLPMRFLLRYNFKKVEKE